jgi:hypothetical protein
VQVTSHIVREVSSSLSGVRVGLAHIFSKLCFASRAWWTARGSGVVLLDCSLLVCSSLFQ